MKSQEEKMITAKVLASNGEGKGVINCHFSQNIWAEVH